MKMVLQQQLLEAKCAGSWTLPGIRQLVPGERHGVVGTVSERQLTPVMRQRHWIHWVPPGGLLAAG